MWAIDHSFSVINVPMALDEGTTAPEIMLFPYNREPATGSRIPSISTGGAARNAVMKHEVAARRVGNIKVPNHPMYRRLSVLVIQLEKRSQVLARSASPFFWRSIGFRVLALNFVSKELSVERSLGTNFKGEPTAALPMRLPEVEAALGMLKASQLEAIKVTTMPRENFMVCFVWLGVLREAPEGNL